MIGLEREIRDVNEKFKTERVSRKEAQLRPAKSGAVPSERAGWAGRG